MSILNKNYFYLIMNMYEFLKDFVHDKSHLPD